MLKERISIRRFMDTPESLRVLEAQMKKFKGI